MDTMINLFDMSSNETVVLACLICSVFRIYLEVIGFDFERLPITKMIANQRGSSSILGFHKAGFYLSVGYFILFAPGYLLS